MTSTLHTRELLRRLRSAHEEWHASRIEKSNLSTTQEDFDLVMPCGLHAVRQNCEQVANQRHSFKRPASKYQSFPWRTSLATQQDYHSPET